MRSFLPSALALGLGLAGSLAAQPIHHTTRHWNPQTFEVARLVPADLDADARDDVLMLLTNGDVVRAANPGVARGFFPAPEFSGISDLVAIRRDIVCDLVVSVSGSQGLAIHGMRPYGAFLTLPSSPTIWNDVTQLRVDEENGPVVAGLAADGKTVYVAEVDTTTFSFTSLGAVTFPQPLIDFELSKRPQDPTVHVVGLSASKLQHRQLGGTLISGMPHQYPEGYIERLPGSQSIAWVHRAAGALDWSFRTEHEGIATIPMPLTGMALTQLDINGLQAADFNQDGHTDLLFGQDSNGSYAVLFGQPNGYSTSTSTVSSHSFNSTKDAQTGVTTFPATVAGYVDGGRLGVFHVVNTSGSLRVRSGVPDPFALADGSGFDEWLPQVYVDSMNPRAPARYLPNRKLEVTLELPENLRDVCEQLQHDTLHIEVWFVDNLTNQDRVTFENASVAPSMYGSFTWTLTGNPVTHRPDALHRVEIPVGLGTSAAPELWNGRHAILLTRIGSTGTGTGGETLVTGSLFSTPIWVAPNYTGGYATFLDGSAAAGYFDPSIPTNNIDWDDIAAPGGAKDIARIRPGLPIFPGLGDVPTPPPIDPQGTTNQ